MYNLPPGVTGAGQKIAVIGEGDMAAPIANLRQFETENGLPQVPVVKHAINNNQTDLSGEGEWDMDTESSTSMAPNVNELDLSFAQSLGVASDAFSAWANDANGPLQANASFGGCESLNLAIGVVATEAPIFVQLAGEGRSQFVSTGDTGGSCTVLTGNGFLNTLAPQVEWPSASPWVVAVGGTVLYTDGAAAPNRVVEPAWSHTGGGTSISQPRPVWQSSIAVITGQCVSDNTGNPVAPPVPCRGLPDVAALSGDIGIVVANTGGQPVGNGFADVEGGKDTGDGGTSLSSPLWTGIWARAQSAASSNLGLATPALYAIGLNASKDANDFFDVSQGSNVQWPALPRSPADPSGWDYVSGLGTPHVDRLIADLTAPSGTIAEVPVTPGLLVAGGVLMLLPAWRRTRRRHPSGARSVPG